MSRRSHLHPASDSLDLLLDTMCNVFGGIILISVMMAVLTRDQAVSERSKQVAAEARDLLQRRISRAEQDLAAAELLKADLNKLEANPATMAAAELMRQREDLVARIENAREAVSKGDRRRAEAKASQFEDPGERQRALLEEMSRLRKTKVSTENKIVSLEEEMSRLASRLADLKQRQDQAQAEATRRMRLPREREKTKLSLAVIIRNGEVHPCYYFSNGRIEPNHVTLDWTAQGKTETATPRKGSGMVLVNDKGEKNQDGVDAFNRWLHSVERDTYYLAFIVYPDSFPAFNAAKDLTTSTGYEYGWTPFDADMEVIFTEKGGRTLAPL